MSDRATIETRTGVSAPLPHGAEVSPEGFVDRMVERLGPDRGNLIPFLQALQQQFRFLPDRALRRLVEITPIRAADIDGVASFYNQFRRKPVGKHLISVCHGTACHVKGAQLITDALRRRLKLGGEEDTDTDGVFTIQSVACLGCCTLAPVMEIDGVTYGRLVAQKAPEALDDFLRRAQLGTTERVVDLEVERKPGLAEIRLGVGSCCAASGALQVRDAFDAAIRDLRAPAVVRAASCSGMCHRIPLVEVVQDGGQPAAYAGVSLERVDAIVRRHFAPQGLLGRVRTAWTSAVERLLSDGAWEPVTRYAVDTRDPEVSAFYGPQVRIAMEHSAALDPLDLGDYVAHEGFRALQSVLESGDPSAVIETVKRSGLRGRGGAGFPTGLKWERVRSAAGDKRYIIMNGDEGDPGAFMDRMLLESFPYRVLEGMAIAAYAVGAHEGVLYIRTEYPHALRHIREAIRRCEQRGVLGDSVCGSTFALRLRVMEGTGAFVCGEETALIASVEGRRGTPSVRPPYPAERGLWGQPTCINNVETYAMVPWIVRHGSDAFAAIGTERSKGTKVFALSGRVRRGGLIEVPMGVTLRQVVEEIGGGVADGMRFKAVQVGGPSGGCIPAEMADTPVDYEALVDAGAIMGSGGLVVLDDRDCMVDIATYFLRFTQGESCGKCTLCRVGTRRMLEILERLRSGEGKRSDLVSLEELAGQVRLGSICGLGQTAPNPVLSTLRYFRDEYEAHVDGRCPAGRCPKLVRYVISDACIGCTRCAQACPVDAIALRPLERHEIDDVRCTRCDACRIACPAGAVSVE
ncbi:MAG TPA: NAD(P)H-dependent oxidoreductase subunit E [Chthonomonadales bacterium]|nr:NAD(P)H-dependent oxidoreductase subunit E [Chthonomonadales bacterium]